MRRSFELCCVIIIQVQIRPSFHSLCTDVHTRLYCCVPILVCFDCMLWTCFSVYSGLFWVLLKFVKSYVCETFWENVRFDQLRWFKCVKLYCGKTFWGNNCGNRIMWKFWNYGTIVDSMIVYLNCMKP